jgi:hypothetical protein
MIFRLCIPPTDTITLNAIQNELTTKSPTGDAKQVCQNTCEIDQSVTKADQHDTEKSSSITFFKKQVSIQKNMLQS